MNIFASRKIATLLGAAMLALLLPTLAQASTPEAKPGSVIRDCKDCPELVVLPAGTFSMGSPDDEMGRQPDEGPQHDVTFTKPFAISRFQVLSGEWNAYLRDTGYTMPDGDKRPGRECIAGKPRYTMTNRHPAVCMDYKEATAYVAWLSKKTGKAYRMVSESVREYAARGGTSGPFPFPLDEGKEYSIAKHANTYGPEDGFSFAAPAGSFAPNAFGMYDMHGNVYEWVADCYNDSYNGAPTDGSPWLTGDCTLQGIRGNDWTEAPIFSRSGNRNNLRPYLRGDWLGFRVVRDL
ncbi:formylglycine-generating enzyme family protein [Pseudomonas sp. DSP3-2-2]|uniref:dihydropyoverdine dehydrogenase n=1 Tax=unclassified Pseudomonas TaxID=196821 RepID=UPI003CF42B79